MKNSISTQAKESLLIQNRAVLWRFSAATWALGLMTLALLSWGYSSSLANLLLRWNTEEAYSHGYFIPLVTLLFIWEQKPKLQSMQFKPSWLGPIILLIALLLFGFGELTALFYLTQISFILVFLGLSLALLGRQGSKLTLIPICLLVFAIPLPGFLEATLTSKLQLVSSQLGVELIRICNIPVFREGNLIDLGSYKLEVAEACSGLTYLYPLLWFGCIFAYLYRTNWWKRVVVILSSIPVAILLNSIRIGTIGVLVNKFGDHMAQGFLHAFEGWVVFMICVGILLAEMWLMTSLGSDQRPFSEVFGLKLHANTKLNNNNSQVRHISKPFILAAGMIAAAVIASGFISDARTELTPQRSLFAAFPMVIEHWQGETAMLENDVLAVLKLNDYLLANFKRGTEAPINFYVAYYASQRKGAAPHSPAVCIPGGGWEITELTQRSLPGMAISGGAYNRAVIRNGKDLQLVYYWYQERGRQIAGEFWAKWYLFQDALLMNRTDGALVRLVTPLLAGEPVEAADLRLTEFMKEVSPVLNQYVPN